MTKQLTQWPGGLIPGVQRIQDPAGLGRIIQHILKSDQICRISVSNVCAVVKRLKIVQKGQLL